MRRAALVALFAATACGHAAVVHHAGQAWVSAVELRGNHAIDDDDLTSGMALRRAQDEGRAVDPYELSLDADRIRGQYARRGYFDTTVTTQVTRAGDAETAIFTVVEGPRAPLVRVDVLGLPDGAAIDAKDVRALIPTADGAPFDYDAYDDAKPRILLAVQDAGYARAHVEATVVADRIHHEAVIRLVIEPGPRCTFGDITIKGVDGPLAGAARARFSIASGDVYSTHAVVKTQSALYDMNRFATVRVEPDRTRDDAVVPVTVTVVEAARHELQLGGGVGADQLTYLLSPHGSYSLAGWPFVLTTAAVSFTPALAIPHAELFHFLRGSSSWDDIASWLRLQALATLTRIDLFHPRITGQIAVAAQYLAVEAYTSVGPRLSLGLTSPIAIPQVQAHVGWSIRDFGFVNISPLIDMTTRDTVLRLDSERVSAFEQSVTADFRDNALEPRNGVYASMRAVEGVKLGGTYAYEQLEPDLRAYVSYGRFTLSAHARVGAFYGQTPATDRYFAGGASSQRGFPERQLSPVATGMVPSPTPGGMPTTATVVVGGTGEILTGAELRTTVAHLYGWPVITALFLDGGDVVEQTDDLSVKDLYWAAGLGFRLATPYGPVRVDFGYRLNRYDVVACTTNVDACNLYPNHRFAYQIGFGEAF